MSWSQIRGHERWGELFRQAVRQKRLAHAYLFVGPHGVGKRMFALELAKALLCERNASDQLDACGQCDACVMVDARTHPDFFLVEKPSEASGGRWTISGTPADDPDSPSKSNVLPIDVMRELCREFGMKSARGQGKVAIVEDADEFNPQSANSFLKTLEEPPPRSVLILLATTLDGQLPTIRSRCQVIRFAPLPETLVRDILGRREAADAKLIPRLAKLAAGSPGQALELAEPELWQFRHRLLQGFAQPKIDTLGLAKGLAEFAEEAGKEAVHQRRRVAQVLKLLVAAWSDVLDVSLGEAVPPDLPEEAALLQALARRTRPDQILAILERCLETEIHLDRYVQVTLVVDALIDALGQILETP